MRRFVRLVQSALTAFFVSSVLKIGSLHPTQAAPAWTTGRYLVLFAELLPVSLVVLGGIWLLPRRWLSRDRHTGGWSSGRLATGSVFACAVLLSATTVDLLRYNNPPIVEKSGLIPPFSTAALLAHPEARLAPAAVHGDGGFTYNPWGGTNPALDATQWAMMMDLGAQAGLQKVAAAANQWDGPMTPQGAYAWYNAWLLGHGWCLISVQHDRPGAVTLVYKEDDRTLFYLSILDLSQPQPQLVLPMAPSSKSFVTTAFFVAAQPTDPPASCLPASTGLGSI